MSKDEKDEAKEIPKIELGYDVIEEITDIEYLQKNLFNSLKIPFNLHGEEKTNVVGAKSLEIRRNQNKYE